jgi:hypothetical protein
LFLLVPFITRIIFSRHFKQIVHVYVER